MRLVAALGLNVWATLCVVPGLYAHASLWPWMLPLAALALAIARPRDVLLLGAVPATLAVAAAVQPEASALLVRPIPLLLAAAGLVGYLYAAARLGQLSSLPAALPVEPLPTVRGPHRQPPIRAILTGYAILGPLVLLHAALLRPGAAQDLATHYPDRPAAGALAICAAAALWVGLAIIYITAALGAPDQRKRTRTEILALRQTLRRARPGLLFYLAVATALGGMAVLVILRYRG